MIAQDQSRNRVEFDPQPFRNENGRLRILLVHKKSRVELQKLDLAKVSSDLADEHQQHLESLRFVRDFLRAEKADVHETFREGLSKQVALGRIIITVGGDGTVLDSSRVATTSPILGVNSDPRRSVGSLCVATRDNFENLYRQIETGAYSVLPLARLGGTLDGKDLGVLALNEVLIAHQNPAAMSRYSIEVDKEVEEHKSSGIWVSTATGSTGAILSAGGHMRPLEDRGVQFFVREPYLSVGRVGRLYSGVASEVTLTSRMPGGKIFFDGPHVAESFVAGSKLVLHSNAQPLNLFVCDEMEYRRGQIAHLRESIHDLIEGSRKC